MSPLDPEVPPVGEEVHLPGPSLLPLFVGLGVTFTVIGITLGMIFWVVGLVILIPSVIRWIGDTRRDIAELPLEHHAEHGHH